MLRKFIIYCVSIVVVLMMFGAPAFAGVTATYSPIQHSWPVIPGTQLQIPLYPDPNVPEGPAGSPNQKVLDGIGQGNGPNNAVMQTFFVPEDSNGFTLTDLVMTAVGEGTDLNPYTTLHLFDINQEEPCAVPHEAGYTPAYDAVPPGYDWFSTNCRFIYARDTNVPSPDKFIRFSFSDYEKVQLEPGHLYAFEIWPTRDISSKFSWIRGATGTVANPYPDGVARFVDDTVGQYEDLYQYRQGVGGSPRDMVLGVYGVPHDGNAYHPWPRDYETAGPPGPNNVLTWKPGADVNDKAYGDNNGHQIYFSVNYNFVNNRAGGAALKKARVTDPNWIPVEVNGAPINLAFDTTYYWRVDEYNDAVKGETGYWGGPVWQFTVAGTYASNPIPNTGATVDFSVDPNSLQISWTAGATVNDVNGHRVYFGTSFAAVSDANTSTSKIYRGVRSSPVYSLLDLYPDYKLTSGTTYFWRIDEVEADNVTVWKGVVWNFVMPDPAYLNVDKFSYSTQEELDAVWKTGYPAPDLPGEPEPGEYNVSGTISPASSQLQFDYDNRSEITGNVPWSEAKLDYNGVTSDWLAGGIFDPCVIGIQYDGTLTNMVSAVDANYDKMYMIVEDISGHIGLVSNPDLYAPIRWLNNVGAREWKVYLSDLTGPSNVSLSDVNAFYLGFGLRNSWSGYGKTSSSSGTVRFDSLRLYVPHCMTEVFTPEGDFAGTRLVMSGPDVINPHTPRDCTINMHDMWYLAYDWLFTEPDLVYDSNVDPNIAGGLRVWYKFDEGSDTSAVLLADSSGNGYEGTIGNLSQLTWSETGHDGAGYCLNLAWGCRTWVDVPSTAYDSGADGVTLALWTDYDVRHQVDIWASVVVLTEGTTWVIETQIPTPFPPETGGNTGMARYGPLARFVDAREGGKDIAWLTPPIPVGRFSNFGGRWNHWAFVYNDTADTTSMYYNGRRVAVSEPNSTLPIWSGITMVRLGTRSSAVPPNWGFWYGKMDDFRMYNRALSDNEIQWLATDGKGFRNMQNQNIEPDELNGDNRINFKDFADFADAWLKQQFLP